MKSIVLVGLLLATPAFAHARLVNSDPAANAKIKSPGQIKLHFSESLEPAFSSASLTDAARNDRAGFQIGRQRYHHAAAADAQAGRLQGDMAQRRPGHPSPDRQLRLYSRPVILALSRGVYYAAAMLLFGEAAFGVLLRAKLPIVMPVRDWSLRWAALLMAGVAGCVWLGLAAAQMADMLNGRVLVEIVTATLFGQLFLVRLAATSGHGAPFAVLARRQDNGHAVSLGTGIARSQPAMPRLPVPLALRRSAQYWTRRIC